LFGYKKGAFSGANQERKGLLASAGHGTVFMDELIELPMIMQSKLLHVFDEKCFRAVGSDKEQPFQARVIAASNADFESAVKEGRLREDLYFRLNVMRIRIPPLRERGVDIVPLALRILTQICKEWSRPEVALSPNQALWIEQQPWRGNVRELRNVLERSLLLGSDTELFFPDISSQANLNHPSLTDACRDYEKYYINSVVQRLDGNKSAAAKELDIGLSTLYRKLEG